jgi:hypothetical protein
MIGGVGVGVSAPCAQALKAKDNTTAIIHNMLMGRIIVILMVWPPKKLVVLAVLGSSSSKSFPMCDYRSTLIR